MRIDSRKILIISMLGIASLYFISLIWLVFSPGFTGISPSPNIVRLMFLRNVLNSIVVFGGLIFVVRLIWDEVFWQYFRVWFIPVVVVAVVCLSLSMRIENPLKNPSCCMDGDIDLWGYPYGWLKCYSYKFCEINRAKIDWLAFAASLIFWVNLEISLIGIGGGIIKRVRGRQEMRA